MLTIVEKCYIILNIYGLAFEPIEQEALYFMTTNGKRAIGVGDYIFNYNGNGVWMNLAIYNKNNELNNYFLSWLDSLSRRMNENIFVDIFDIWTDMVSNINSGEEYDLIIIFCDYDSSTFDLGPYIREKMHNQTVEIVYILTTNYVPVKLANTKPLVVLVFPVTEKDFEHILNLFYATKCDLRLNYFYKTRKVKKLIPYKDIMYISSNIRILTIVTTNGTYTCYDKIKNIPNVSGFYRVNKSFLINANYLKICTKDYILMENNEKITLSRSIRKNVRDELRQYVIRNSAIKTTS